MNATRFGALICVSGLLLGGFTACNKKATPVVTPTSTPTAAPCVLPSGTSQTASTFPASQASGTAFNVPAVDNITDVMNAGTLAISPSNTNLLFAIADGTCLTVPTAGSVYQYIAITAAIGSVQFPTIPSFVFTFPASVSLSGKSFTLQQYTPSATNPLQGTWAVVLGPVSPTGQTVTFAAAGTGFTVAATSVQGVIFALTSTP